MNYRLCKNVVLNFEKDRIVFIKGVWELVPFEVSKNQYREHWQKINVLLHQLVLSHQLVRIDQDTDDVLVKLFEQLEKINLVYVPNTNVRVHYLVCSEAVYDFIQENAATYGTLSRLEFIDILQFEKYSLTECDHFLIICNDCSFWTVRKINEKLIAEHKKYYCLILKRDFLHIFFHNSVASPCFECYYETIINQIENENYLEFLKLKDINQHESFHNEQIVKLNYSLAYFYLLLTGNHYFENEKTNHKLISFYFPTLEMKIVNFPRKSDCIVCRDEFLPKT